MTRPNHRYGQWYPEIRHLLSGVPIILLGMKSDLRDHAHQPGMSGDTGGTQMTTDHGPIVSEQRARRMAELLGAEAYLECSAEDIDSIHNLFNILTVTSLRYTAHTQSCQTRGRGCEQKGRSESARKSFFSMPDTYN